MNTHINKLNLGLGKIRKQKISIVPLDLKRLIKKNVGPIIWDYAFENDSISIVWLIHLSSYIKLLFNPTARQYKKLHRCDANLTTLPERSVQMLSLCRIDLRLIWSPYPIPREIQNVGSTAMKCEPGPMDRCIRKPSCQMYASSVIHRTQSWHNRIRDHYRCWKRRISSVVRSESGGASIYCLFKPNLDTYMVQIITYKQKTSIIVFLWFQQAHWSYLGLAETQSI